MTTNKQLQEWLQHFPDDAEVKVRQEFVTYDWGSYTKHVEAWLGENCTVWEGFAGSSYTIYLGEN
jgi:hypothetical protein